MTKLQSITMELDRINGGRRNHIEERCWENYSAEDYELFHAFPEEVRAIAEYLVHEDSFPHHDVTELLGVDDLVELHGAEGIIGMQKTRDDFMFRNVVMFGEDAYYDRACELGNRPGAIYLIHDYDFEHATLLSPSVLSFLQSVPSFEEARA